MPRTMKIFLVLLLVPFFTITANAASVPILYCVNEKAGAHDCITEAEQAMDATEDWFKQYLTKHGGSFSGRHLLDCKRFCDSDPKFFSVHYPCHCRDSRKLNVIEFHDEPRTLEYDPLEGPVQLFRDFSYRLPQSDCKKVLEEAHCMVIFVQNYAVTDADNNSSPESDSNDGDEDAAGIDEMYDPNTGTYQLYDPETGELLTPENDEDEDEEDEDEEKFDALIFDPVTGKWLKVDPNTGFAIGDNNGDNNEPSEPDENNGIIYAEVYDPVTGTYQKIDPSTGLPVDP